MLTGASSTLLHHHRGPWATRYHSCLDTTTGGSNHSTIWRTTVSHRNIRCEQERSNWIEVVADITIPGMAGSRWLGQPVAACLSSADGSSG